MADRDRTTVGRWSATAVARPSDGGRPREIRLDDGAGAAGSSYPLVWLRNNCPCPSCASRGSGFRKQVIRDLPFHSAPVDFKVSLWSVSNLPRRELTHAVRVPERFSAIAVGAFDAFENPVSSGPVPSRALV